MALDLGKWLRATPQPHSIVADGRKIEVGHRAGKWKDVMRSITAIAPSRLEALDSSGTLIRAVSLEDEDTGASALPAGEERVVATFAKLLSDTFERSSKTLAEAYDKGARATQPLLDNSMAFIERQSQRIQSQEREIQQLRDLNNKLQAELLAITSAATGEDDESVLGGLLQGLMMAKAEKEAAKEKANGAALAKTKGPDA